MKFLKGLALVIGVIIVISALITGFIYYFKDHHIRDIDSSYSHDKKYRVTLSEVGRSLDFRKSDIKISIYDSDGKQIDEINTSIKSSGEELSEDSWDVYWTETIVEIVLKAKGQDDEIINIVLP